MWTVILRTLLQVLAGVGVGELADKFVKPKLPENVYPEPVGFGFRFPRLLWIVAAFVAGALALKFIGKKFKISILK